MIVLIACKNKLYFYITLLSEDLRLKKVLNQKQARWLANCVSLKQAKSKSLKVKMKNYRLCFLKKKKEMSYSGWNNWILEKPVSVTAKYSRAQWSYCSSFYGKGDLFSDDNVVKTTKFKNILGVILDQQHYFWDWAGTQALKSHKILFL